MKPFTILALISSIWLPISHAVADELQNLIVYGDGFAFHVREPEGWVSDIEYARSIGNNIAFTKGPKFDCSQQTLISVRINETTDHKIELDLKADKASFLKSHPKSKAAPFEVANIRSGWRCVGTDYVGKTAHEYVSFCTPGSGPFMFSISINKQSTAGVSPEELEAFNTIVRSLGLIAGE